MSHQTGQILNNRYRIIKLLGQGGFGAVYRAWDMSLRRPCAVKENLETDPLSQKQFEHEATVLANLAHPNLPRVMDHFNIPGQGQYLVMDFVEGHDLDSILLKHGPLPVKDAVSLISQIADALTYLHTRKPPVIHRDIKPANIRVDSQGKAYLVDFGLVKLYQTSVPTTPGARGVTPGFSPPEQYGHGSTDARTDIYALAATLYNLVTGQSPLESVRRYKNQLTPAHYVNPSVPEAVGAAIEQAMALNPNDRFGNAAEFELALNAATPVPKRSGAVVSPPTVTPTPPTTISQPVARPIASGMKIWTVIGIVSALVVLCGLGVGYAVYKIITPSPTSIGLPPPQETTLTPTSDIFPPSSDDTTLTPTPDIIPPVSDDITLTPVPTETSIPPQVATLTPTLAPTPSDTPSLDTVDNITPEGNFDLAFASDRNGDFQVYLMDTQTEDFLEIPRPSGYERVWWPSFCGNRIAVEAVDLNSSENRKQWIFLMETNGNKERVDAPKSPALLGVPRCSPDNRFLAYSANVDNLWAMFVTDYSSTYKIYPTNGWISGYASWPSQGESFIFQVITQKDSNNQYKTYIYKMNGHVSAKDYDQIGTGANPSISPDGSRIVYSCRASGNDRTLCIASANRENESTLVTIKRIELASVGWNIQPSSVWSADGQWVYFASAADGDWDIYRIHPDGSGLKNLTNHWGASHEIMPALRR